MDKKITLFLMGQRGFAALQKFIETFGAQFIDFVVCARDKNLQKDYFDEISTLCKRHNIKFFDRRQNFKIRSKYSFAVSWRWMINDLHTRLIVLHDSILPMYRGYAPLVNSLINGEKEIGVTAFFADKHFDKGDIIKQVKVKVKYPIKINEAITRLSRSYCDIIIAVSDLIINNKKIESYPQNKIKGSYCLWLDECDYRINWQTDSKHIKRFIDSVGYPYKGASSIVNEKIVRILDCEVINDIKIENRVPGKVIFIDNGHPIVVCKKGLLKITKVIDDKTKEDITPFRRLRIRFK